MTSGSPTDHASDAVGGEGDDGAVVGALEGPAAPHLGDGREAARHLRARRILDHRFHTRGWRTSTSSLRTTS